jgi:hypothetical protein
MCPMVYNQYQEACTLCCMHICRAHTPCHNHGPLGVVPTRARFPAGVGAGVGA